MDKLAPKPSFLKAMEKVLGVTKSVSLHDTKQQQALQNMTPDTAVKLALKEHPDCSFAMWYVSHDLEHIEVRLWSDSASFLRNDLPQHLFTSA